MECSRTTSFVHNCHSFLSLISLYQHHHLLLFYLLFTPITVLSCPLSTATLHTQLLHTRGTVSARYSTRTQLSRLPHTTTVQEHWRWQEDEHLNRRLVPGRWTASWINCFMFSFKWLKILSWYDSEKSGNYISAILVYKMWSKRYG